MHPGEWVFVEYWWAWVILAIVEYFVWADHMICAADAGPRFWKAPRRRQIAIVLSILLMIACVIVAFKALYHRFLL